ncbi:hypothetical protein PMIN06_006727 [Paraphaeosphaeria minitans]
MRQALADSELARSEAETRLQTFHRDHQNVQSKISEYQLEIVKIKNDTGGHKDPLRTFRGKADWWAQHHHDNKLKVDGHLRDAKETIRDFRKELTGSKQAILDLQEKCRYINSRYRDATQFDVVKKALHQCAETKGDGMIVAVAFTKIYRGNGGSLPSLGVDPERFEALRYFVGNRQDPSLAVQPAGFAFR